MSQRQAKAPLSLGLFLLLFAMLASLQYRLWFGNTGSYAEITRLQQSIDENRKSNDEQAERNRVLSAQVRDLKKDRESLKKDNTSSADGISALEERARSELGMIRRDETFYLIVDDKRRTKP